MTPPGMLTRFALHIAAQAMVIMAALLVLGLAGHPLSWAVFLWFLPGAVVTWVVVRHLWLRDARKARR